MRKITGSLNGHSIARLVYGDCRHASTLALLCESHYNRSDTRIALHILCVLLRCICTWFSVECCCKHLPFAPDWIIISISIRKYLIISAEFAAWAESYFRKDFTRFFLVLVKSPAYAQVSTNRMGKDRSIWWMVHKIENTTRWKNATYLVYLAKWYQWKICSYVN